MYLIYISSLNCNAPLLSDHIFEFNSDIIALTEIWLLVNSPITTLITNKFTSDSDTIILTLLTADKQSLRIILIYRPPSSSLYLFFLDNLIDIK